MEDDCLALTVYLAERRRTGHSFVSDVLLGLYQERGICSSVVLRGISGFGTDRHFRTDESLTLSEDPPMLVKAVDTREAIEELLEPVLAIKQRGLVTLERARLVRGHVGPLRLPVELSEAIKLTIYVGRRQRIGGAPAYIAICDLMYRRGIAGASVFLGVDGTAHGVRQRARLFGRNADVPMMIVAVGSGDLIGQVMAELGGLLHDPLMTVERVRVCKRDGVVLERPHALPGVDEHGLPLWQKLTIYTSESAHHGRLPIHRALIQRLGQRETPDGATVLRGIWGFHGDHQPHGDKLFSLARHVPVATIVVDTPDNIAKSFDVVDELTQGRGLVTSEMVPALVSDEYDPGKGAPPTARYAY